jgi:TP53 regulating kinase and related kinases
MKIAQGAEAVILKEKDKIIKDRVPKTYRLKQLDESLRTFRTKREIKVLETLRKANIPVPAVLKKDTTSFVMECIPGEKVRDVLDAKPKLAFEIGQLIAKVHDLDIIHGDLTTSNMIFDKHIYLIDFGLSFFSQKIEDKAVDIHLFKQALESKHYKVYDVALKHFLEGYVQAKQSKEILKQLETVESRGRYKQKY